MTTDDRAERLARLQARRPTAPSPAEPTATATTQTPVATRRRRSPAVSAKVLTVGASTTAVLGMMAGYGMAEGRADQVPTLEPAADAMTGSAGPITTTPIPTTLAPPLAPIPTAPPQVIVVMIDGETGRPIDTDALAKAALDGELTATDTSAPPAAPESATPAPTLDTPVPTAAPAPEPAPAPAPAPPPQPVAVDVAVPVPAPAPAPAPAAAPAAAPAPAPEAKSSGS